MSVLASKRPLKIWNFCGKNITARSMLVIVAAVLAALTSSTIAGKKDGADPVTVQRYGDIIYVSAHVRGILDSADQNSYVHCYQSINGRWFSHGWGTFEQAACVIADTLGRNYYCYNKWGSMPTLVDGSVVNMTFRNSTGECLHLSVGTSTLWMKHP
jgi:hypothetical protein